MATILEWLAEAGHSCRAVTAGRFGQSPGLTIRAYHDALRVTRCTHGPRPTVRYRRAGVEGTAVETVHTNPMTPDPGGISPFKDALSRALRDKPDVVLAYGGFRWSTPDSPKPGAKVPAPSSACGTGATQTGAGSPTPTGSSPTAPTLPAPTESASACTRTVSLPRSTGRLSKLRRRPAASSPS